jgi:DNA-binding transcriptional regulator YdaS (Cro superfamily)
VDNVFERLVSHLGSQAALASAFDVTPQAVSRWKRLGKIPANRALDVEKLTKGAIPAREVLKATQ